PLAPCGLHGLLAVSRLQHAVTSRLQRASDHDACVFVVVYNKDRRTRRPTLSHCRVASLPIQTNGRVPGGVRALGGWDVYIKRDGALTNAWRDGQRPCRCQKKVASPKNGVNVAAAFRQCLERR